MYKGATIYIYLYERMPPTPSRFIHIISTGTPQLFPKISTGYSQRYLQDIHITWAAYYRGSAR
jgi:hypothetical protein